jgi:aminopeptidase YwaD
MKKGMNLLWALLLMATSAHGQTDSTTIKQFIRREAAALTADAMHGRGYVQEGRMVASAYIQSRFKEMGLQPAPGSHGYTQSYYFPVNTFPGKMKLVVNGKEMKAGADYIIDAGSPSITAKDLPVKTVELGGITDMQGLKAVLRSFNGSEAYMLTHIDSLCKTLGARVEEVAMALPQGCYIIAEPHKLTWTVAEQAIAATVFYVIDSALPANINKVSTDVKAVLLHNARNENIIAVAPGRVADSFIAITGHYDHLGMMGLNAVFPGASDNASGISMLLYLASYFVAHPQHYSILFICFSGEEAGLLGSAYYVAHPTVPLNRIKFLTNIDIMGDATDGVTVVNATEFPKQFALLQGINTAHKYIPVIKSRGKAHNSDHYHFTEAGVPSFFMYSNGGKGFYHDIFDTADEITLNHVDGVAELLMDFLEGM